MKQMTLFGKRTQIKVKNAGNLTVLTKKQKSKHFKCKIMSKEAKQTGSGGYSIGLIITVIAIIIVILCSLLSCEKEEEEFDYDQYIGYWESKDAGRSIDIQCIDPLLAKCMRGNTRIFKCTSSHIENNKLYFVFAYSYSYNVAEILDLEVAYLNNEEISVVGILTAINENQEEKFIVDWIFKRSVNTNK